MFRTTLNFLQGRREYKTACFTADGIAQIIAELPNEKSVVLDTGEDEDRDFDTKVDLLREMSNTEKYHVKSVWKDTFSGRESRKIYFEVYADDRKAGRAIRFKGNYVLEEKVRVDNPERMRSAWFGNV